MFLILAHNFTHPPKIKLFKLKTNQQVHLPHLQPHLIQIKASDEEIYNRIFKFMEKKREEINRSNVRDFCRRNPDDQIENSCARIDSILLKRRDSKSHLKGK